MAKNTLPMVNKGLAEEKKAKEVAEETAAAAKPRKGGHVLVRLRRPFLLASGKLLAPGLHELPEDMVPGSAKRVEATKSAENPDT